MKTLHCIRNAYAAPVNVGIIYQRHSCRVDIIRPHLLNIKLTLISQLSTIMKWSYAEADQIFRNCTNDLASNMKLDLKIDQVAARFVEAYRLSLNPRSLRMRFRRLVESRPSRKASSAPIAEFQNKVFYECDALSEREAEGKIQFDTR